MLTQLFYLNSGHKISNFVANKPKYEWLTET